MRTKLLSLKKSSNRRMYSKETSFQLLSRRIYRKRKREDVIISHKMSKSQEAFS
jgi:hypothetical protein